MKNKLKRLDHLTRLWDEGLLVDQKAIDELIALEKELSPPEADYDMSPVDESLLPDWSK